MQDHENNSKNSNIRRMSSGEGRPNGQQRPSSPPRRPAAEGQQRPSSSQRRPTTEGQQRPSSSQRRPAAEGQQRPNSSPRRPTAEGQQRPSSSQRRPVTEDQQRPMAEGQQRRPAAEGTSRSSQQRKPAAEGVQRTDNLPRRPAERAPRPSGQQRPVEGAQRSSQQRRPTAESQSRPKEKAQNTANSKPKKNPKSAAPQKAPKKKGIKILLFVAEIFVLLILVGVLWAVNKAQKIQLVEIKPEDVHINEPVRNEIESGTTIMKGYRNIALFGVDSRNKELDKSTRTDVIMVASINQDTKEVRLISIYRDTWLNMTNDKYSKANAAYAKGGAKQAIGMLNMNLDLDITDFVTVGFDAVIDVIDAIGGVEIDVKQEEIVHLNSYQISMVGRVVGKLDNGDEIYEATPGVEYTPVTKPGLQTLNGLQATAYSRIRYTSGGDGARTQRQRTVLTKIAQKAMTMKPETINKIVDTVFGEIATSLTMSEIGELLSDITSYQIGETAGFPFDEHVKMDGWVGKASVVVPVDLTKNVTLLHEFLFDESDYIPTDTVKKCSQKIASDTGVSYNGE